MQASGPLGLWDGSKEPLLSGVPAKATFELTHTPAPQHTHTSITGCRPPRLLGPPGPSCSELDSAGLGVEGRWSEVGHDLRTFSCLPSLTNEAVHTCSTIGSNVEEIVLQKTHFLMWDLGGQETLRSTWDTYYSNAEVRRERGWEAGGCVSACQSLTTPLSLASATWDVIEQWLLKLS